MGGEDLARHTVPSRASQGQRVSASVVFTPSCVFTVCFLLEVDMGLRSARVHEI